MSVLSVEQLRGGYAGASVLCDVALTVDAGECVGVLGANGAGKTTLLRALSGDLPICSGAIRLDGRDIHKLSPWRRAKCGLSHVPEGRHVFAGMTVRENLAVATLTGPRSSRRLDNVWDLFPRLYERQNQLGESLSGGEQQMLAISRALLTRPRLLMIDEMSAGLAPVMVQQLMVGLRAVLDAGIGLLLVEQTPQLIARDVDRVYLIERGRIVGQGTFDDLGGVQALAELYLGMSA